MGLDNIPNVYPCKQAGTAVMEDGPFESGPQINCEKTQDAGGCPWKTEFDKSPFKDGHALGLFGVPCWYRGKVVTNYLFPKWEAAHPDDDPPLHTWYSEDASPDECRESAKWMEDRGEPFLALVTDDKTEEQSWGYAAWWLRFVADHAEGMHGWW